MCKMFDLGAIVVKICKKWKQEQFLSTVYNSFHMKNKFWDGLELFIQFRDIFQK